jgi:hypothetical protein
MDASTELNELWELLDKGSEGNQSLTGRHEAWPEELGTFVMTSPTGKETLEVFYKDGCGRCDASYVLPSHHALAIVRDSVEGWLVERGWVCLRGERDTWYTLYLDPNTSVDKTTLPDAVRYAMTQE